MLVLSHGKGSQVHLDTKDGRITLKFNRFVRITYDLPESVEVTRDEAKVKQSKETK